jgi:hypothetical protein
MVAWPGQQWHDRRAKSSSGAGVRGVGHAYRWLEDTASRVVALHLTAVASEVLHVCFLLKTNVSLQIYSTISQLKA